ncbi:MAG TPA: imidazolonepropionase [bacterium]|nr:imidazolonepropionase [bacterium]
MRDTRAYTLILTDISELFTASPQAPALTEGPFCVAVDDRGLISFVGRQADLALREPNYETAFAAAVVSAGGRAVWPGLVDSHTHLVYAGTREEEFALKARGASYADIAAKGGGILNSAKKTRAASADDLFRESRRRLLQVAAYGVTTIEMKSGYALDVAGELQILEVTARLARELPVAVVPTLLGAHAYPERFRNDHAGYISLLCDELMPEVKRRGLAEFVDVFCEEGYFSLAETERILSRARELGFKLKLHADQFHALGGTELAARMGAASVDHLEEVTDAAIRLMADNGTVAGVLPITSVFSRLPFAPARRMADAGVRVALATDFNPGSCMCGFLPLAASLGTTQLSLSPEEAACGITLNGAASIGRERDRGSIEVGKAGDLIVMESRSWLYPIYHMAHNHVRRMFIGGRPFEPAKMLAEEEA